VGGRKSAQQTLDQFKVEAIQTRDYCVANPATFRADRVDPFAARRRLAQDDNQAELQLKTC
jgi:hypothetical protein